MEAEAPAPLVVDLKRNALDDGPGIRTVVFFKGCPLRCAWCQNPEGLAPRAELQQTPSACLDCGACTRSCPRGVGRPARSGSGGAGCTACGTCVAACPASARRIVGARVSEEALVARLLLDAPFYRRSGGGVTFSGGEPALFAQFVGGVARRLRAEGVPVLLETCGAFDFESVAAHLLPHLSTIYFDLKLADASRHRRWTGRGNEDIHENLRRVLATGFRDLLPRVPLVPGATDDDENLGALARLARGMGLRRLALLPYNPLWVPKRRALGGELPYAHEAFMSEPELARCRRAVEAEGVEVVLA